MIIFFGTKPRTKVVGSGQFYCPNCQVVRNYERKQGKNYLTVYFIPIFPIGDLHEFVECQTCRLAFKPDVLSYQPPKRQRTLTEMLNALKADLENGMPIEYVVRDLTAAGLDRDIALNNVNAVIGKDHVLCKSCGLSYASHVKQCGSCNQPLTL